MLEKLLRFQTIPGPYLGPAQPLQATAQTAPARFQHWLQQTQSPQPQPLLPLKSVSQHLQINLRPAAQPGQYQLQHQPLQSISQLSQTVQQQLQQHPARSQSLEAWLQASLLLLCFKTAKGRRPPPELLQPSPFAMLSALPTERSYAHERQRLRRTSLTGRHFWDFELTWEKTPAEEAEAGAL
ncbi:MAG: hypothetical protein IGS03_17040 [Candidatus Sericytochromatia bacterium]|nr:hypothetical protein [Candidatus Sericytochromatia bacterium]